MVAYKTQKARGLNYAWFLSGLAAYGYKVAPLHGVWPHTPYAAIQALSFPKFARPCPTVPRHGFVESRDVANPEEFYSLCKETLAQDPDGEVLIMDRLSGKYSAVMTATGVTWGMSNDGVTGGHGRVKIIPTPAGRFDATLLAAMGIKETDQGVYVELVEDKGNVCIVQLRLGPKQESASLKRFVPGLSRDITTVFQPVSDDLIAWNKTLVAYQDSSLETLVWLPGQTMSSHFAVQAIALGYSVSVETKCPIEGAGTLRQEGTQVQPLKPMAYRRLAKMLEKEKKVRFWDGPRSIMLSVATLHSLTGWGDEKHLLALRARGAVIAARYAMAACLGESRHRLTNLKAEPIQVPWKELAGDMGGAARPERSFVFNKALSLPWEKCAELCLAASIDMRLSSQPPVMEHLAAGGKLGDYKASFMGQKWEYAAIKAHDLFKAIDAFCAKPNAAGWGAILALYNEIINAAHNGGYLLNKWLSQSLIDNAVSMPALVFGYKTAMDLVWNIAYALPSSPWRPLKEKPSDIYFHKTDNGVFIPKKLWQILVDRGEASSLPCLCADCMASKWQIVASTAIEYDMPCYGPASIISGLPIANESINIDVPGNDEEEKAEEEEEEKDVPPECMPEE